MYEGTVATSLQLDISTVRVPSLALTVVLHPRRNDFQDRNLLLQRVGFMVAFLPKWKEFPSIRISTPNYQALDFRTFHHSPFGTPWRPTPPEN